jgi:hypothetical protein
VPGHKLVHKSCFHVVPNKAVIDATGNVIAGGTPDGATGTAIGGTVVDHIAECQYPARDAAAGGGGWIEALWSNSTISYFTGAEGTFHVPVVSPPQLNQQIYLFFSLENTTAPFSSLCSSGARGRRMATAAPRNRQHGAFQCGTWPMMARNSSLRPTVTSI